MLVSVGSALLMIVSAYGFDRVLQPGRVVLDPSRWRAGRERDRVPRAGTIVVRKQWVHGLTTAASIWAVAAIGMARGALTWPRRPRRWSCSSSWPHQAAGGPPPRHGHRDHGPSTEVAEPFEVAAIESFPGLGRGNPGIRVRDGALPGEREIEVNSGPAPAFAALRLVAQLKEIAACARSPRRDQFARIELDAPAVASFVSGFDDGWYRRRPISSSTPRRCQGFFWR